MQDFISSGILEAYALGEVTAAERASVEQALKQHPEVRAELDRIEKTMEGFVVASAIAPRPEVRENLMSKITSGREGRVVALSSSTPIWKYAAAASIAIALVTSYLAFYYRQQWKDTALALDQIITQNRQMAEEYNVVNQKLDKLQADLGIIENTAFTKVVMTGTLNDKSALASVYWNASTTETYISIQQLKAIAKENQFQLWAIVDGKPVDVGVFDLDPGLIKMKNVKGAAAFAVTVEPRGGNVSPTLGTMQVIGFVHITPS